MFDFHALGIIVAFCLASMNPVVLVVAVDWFLQRHPGYTVKLGIFSVIPPEANSVSQDIE